MTYRNPHHLRALGCLLVLAIGCKSSQHSILPEPAPDPQQIGVFASTDRGLLELTATESRPVCKDSCVPIYRPFQGRQSYESLYQYAGIDDY